MKEIKSYRPATHSLSSSQVLAEPYTFAKARVVTREMADAVALHLVDKQLVADQFSLMVNYDTSNPANADMVRDWYGRRVPRPVHGSARLPQPTSSSRAIVDALMEVYDRIVDPRLLVRRITIGTYHVVPETEVQGQHQLNLFADSEVAAAQHQAAEQSRKRERRMQEATLAIKKKFGKNAILRGTDFDEGATARDRNRQIGGHKA